jgi:hypothetical protein
MFFGDASVLGLCLLTTATFLASLMFWRRNAGHRRELLRALGPGGPPLPEEVIKWVGVAEMTRFIDLASRATTASGVSALDLYRAPMLLWNDVWFAVSFACFLIFGNLTIAKVLPAEGFAQGWMLFGAAMGAVYGAADIGEDLMLARLFSAGLPVDRAMAFIASLLTRIKFLTLLLALPASLGFLAILGCSALIEWIGQSDRTLIRRADGGDGAVRSRDGSGDRSGLARASGADCGAVQGPEGSRWRDRPPASCKASGSG